MNDRGRARTRVSARHRKIAEELQFATWLGWLLAPDSLVVPLRNPHQDPAEIAWQALKIGYGLAGELDGGMPAWVAAGQPIAATALVTPGAIQDRE